MNPSDYTVAELKELLPEKNLPTSGNKADLIMRLEKDSPDMWNRIQQKDRQIEQPDEIENDS